MKNYILLLLSLITINNLLASEAGGDPPVANFSYYIEFVGFGSEVYYLNESTDGVTYFWDFGDGGTSTELNPVHAYTEPGFFIVCLTATNDFGSDTYCDTLNTYYSPSADFSFTGDPTVIFTDMTTNFPTTWDWFFGDGDMSSLQNPEHTYLVNGDYSACLSAGNPGGTSYVCKTVTISSYVTTEAAFSYSGDPMVAFTDLSTLDPFEWEWDFGDGSISSVQNPIHTYIEEGTFTVCLTATNAGGSNTYCEEIIIEDAIAEPEADFSYLIIDLGIALVDETTNDPFAWDWDFGDGNTSTEQNPIHVYAESGNYDICLIATNAGGNNMVCKNVFLETEINDISIQNCLIYPNPASESITIQLQYQISEGKLIVYDISGKIVSQIIIQSEDKIFLSLKELEQGNYTFVIKNENIIVGKGNFVRITK